MKSPGCADQQLSHYMFDASGTVGTTPALILGRSKSRSYFLFINTSAAPLALEFDGARATATITSGQVSGTTITNAGFGYTKPPRVRFEGGGYEQLAPNGQTNPSYLGLNQPNGESPSKPAKGQGVLTSGALSSILLNEPGAKYAIAPYVLLDSDPLDPYGCAAPSLTSGLGSIIVQPNGVVEYNGTVCPTGPCAVIGSTTGQGFTCKWMS